MPPVYYQTLTTREVQQIEWEKRDGGGGNPREKKISSTTTYVQRQSSFILLKNSINIKDEFTCFLHVHTKGIETCSYLQLWGSSLMSRLRGLLNTDEDFLSA